MTRVQFEAELEEVRDTASRMAALVEQAIRKSVMAVLNHDRQLADEVIAGDEEINMLHHNLREDVFVVIATQQPVARDLRLLMGVQYIGAELERMGDYATRIAKRAKRLADEPEAGPGVYVDLGRMAELVEKQVHDILDAFVAVDAEAATKVAEQDDAIDRLYHKIFAEQISALATESAHVMRAQYLLNIAHTLERLGDRVTNVAEDIVFLDTGKVVELD
jgi:phosphate transport system protein